MRRDRLFANSPYEILTGERCQLKLVFSACAAAGQFASPRATASVAAWSKGKRNDRDRRF